MEKALAAIGLVAALLVAVEVLLVAGTALYVVAALLPLAAGVLAFFRRGPEGIGVGVLLVLAGLAGIMLSIGAITFRGGASVGEATENYIGWAAGATAALLVPGAVSFLARERLQPWMPITAVVAVVVAIVFLWIGVSQIGEYQAWSNWVAALAALVSAVPMVAMMRPPEGHETSARATD